MRSALVAEYWKVRTTRTTTWLSLAMIGLVLLAVLLHGFGFPARELADRPNQIRVLIAGETVGALFAALFGALSVTAEIRHGTIRPTFLASPVRRTVVLAKAVAALLVGLFFGFAATAAAASAGSAALSIRDISSQLDLGDYVQLMAGGAIASGLWGAIGLGVGSLVRHQVGTVVGLFVWLQIVENLLIDSVPKFSRFMPGSLAQSIAGSEAGALSSPTLALVLLVGYVGVAMFVGTTRIVRSDLA